MLWNHFHSSPQVWFNFNVISLRNARIKQISQKHQRFYITFRPFRINSKCSLWCPSPLLYSFRSRVLFGKWGWFFYELFVMCHKLSCVYLTNCLGFAWSSYFILVRIMSLVYNHLWSCRRRKRHANRQRQFYMQINHYPRHR